MPGLLPEDDRQQSTRQSHRRLGSKRPWRATQNAHRLGVGVMVELFNRWNWRVRRKAPGPQCIWCGQTVVPGERYAHHFGFSEDEWQHPFGTDMHEECHEAMACDGWEEWEPYAPRPEKVLLDSEHARDAE